MAWGYILYGMIAGFAIGIIASFVSPQLLILGFKYSLHFNQAVGWPVDYFTTTMGSIIRIMLLISFFFALAGGILGFISYIISRFLNK
jgi:hypothetical protein